MLGRDHLALASEKHVISCTLKLRYHDAGPSHLLGPTDQKFCAGLKQTLSAYEDFREGLAAVEQTGPLLPRAQPPYF